jgi:hypothetical protein
MPSGVSRSLGREADDDETDDPVHDALSDDRLAARVFASRHYSEGWVVDDGDEIDDVYAER